MGSMSFRLNRTRSLLALLFMIISWPVLLASADEVEKMLFLVVEKDSIIASNTKLGRFDRLTLSAKETIDQYKAANAVAVVVTNQRVAAYSVYQGDWISRRLQAGETIESVEVADYSLTIVTNDRLMNFHGRDGAWSVTKR
jgi:hypothetical protein